MFRYILAVSLSSFYFSFGWAHVAMVYPKGGETIQGGGILDIRWEIVIEHQTLNWDLYYTLDDGVTWTTIKEDIAANSLGYSWEVPTINSKTVKIRVVQDNQLADYDDISKNFIISSTTTAVHNGNTIPFTLVKQPVHDQLEINIRPSEDGPHPDQTYAIDLFDLEGHRLRQETFFSKAIYLDINALPPNIYLIVVSGSSRRGVKKFIKI